MRRENLAEPRIIWYILPRPAVTSWLLSDHHNIIWRRKAATAVGMIIKVLNVTFFRSIREKKVYLSLTDRAFCPVYGL